MGRTGAGCNLLRAVGDDRADVCTPRSRCYAAAFGIDRGLGGKPAPDYCILACEQWNSPLYCDSKHPQAGAAQGGQARRLGLALHLLTSSSSCCCCRIWR